MGYIPAMPYNDLELNYVGLVRNYIGFIKYYIFRVYRHMGGNSAFLHIFALQPVACRRSQGGRRKSA